jgi:D-methionine transport system ATP-binding protein
MSSQLDNARSENHEVLIRFDDVSKVFGDVNAVDGISFSILQGEIFGIIGRSGAGKSTLVRLINALEKLSGGEIYVDDVKITSKTRSSDLKQLRTNIGMIFQSFNLFGSRTVFKNVEYPLKLAGVDKAQRRTRVLELLDFVGLAEKADVYPSKLSGGQKQRVGIARALATNPKILLADEATSALDPETTLDILKLLKKVNVEFKTTIVVITHTMSVVKLICDKVAVMNDGKVVEIGETSKVFENPQHEVTKNFISTLRTLESGKL